MHDLCVCVVRLSGCLRMCGGLIVVELRCASRALCAPSERLDDADLRADYFECTSFRPEEPARWRRSTFVAADDDRATLSEELG